MKKIYIVVLVVFLLSIFGVFGYFYWSKNISSSHHYSEQVADGIIEENMEATSEIVILDSEDELKTLLEQAEAVAVERPQDEGWMPIDKLFDDLGWMKSDYYNTDASNPDLNKLPFPKKKPSDFKWKVETIHDRDLNGSKAKFRDECFAYCVFVKDKLLTSFEQIWFSGSFILNEDLIEFYVHGGSGAYMPATYTFIKIDTNGNTEIIEDNHESLNEHLARINQLGLEVDLRPFRKLNYFLLFNENGLNVSLLDSTKRNTNPKVCKKYYDGAMQACPRLYECKADVVVQELARAYAGYVDYSVHDPNIDEKQFNQICFKICRNEAVSYTDFEEALCKAS